MKKKVKKERFLNKEEFISLVQRKQKERKELGMELDTLNDEEFKIFLTNLLIKFGNTSEKEKVKPVEKEAKKEKKTKTTKTVKKEVEQMFKLKEVNIVKKGKKIENVVQLAFDF